MVELTKVDLQRIQDLHRQLLRDNDQLYALQEMAAGLGSQAFDNVRVQHTPVNSGGNRFAEAAADLGSIIRQEERELKYLRKLLKRFLKTLEDPVEVRIMELRYLDCYGWTLIARLISYTERHVYRIHNKVIENIPDE